MAPADSDLQTHGDLRFLEARELTKNTQKSKDQCLVERASHDLTFEILGKNIMALLRLGKVHGTSGLNLLNGHFQIFPE